MVVFFFNNNRPTKSYCFQHAIVFIWFFIRVCIKIDTDSKNINFNPLSYIESHVHAGAYIQKGYHDHYILISVCSTRRDACVHRASSILILIVYNVGMVCADCLFDFNLIIYFS